VSDLDLIWLISDVLNALMALPNLIGLVLLSPVVVALTKEYFMRTETAANKKNSTL